MLWAEMKDCPAPSLHQAALKKYQTEHKSKGESLEKSQAELKKLRRKSQGSKHPSKYGDKEMQVREQIWASVTKDESLLFKKQEKVP